MSYGYLLLGQLRAALVYVGSRLFAAFASRLCVSPPLAGVEGKPPRALSARDQKLEKDIAPSPVRSSRLPGFYDLPVAERLSSVQNHVGLSPGEVLSLHQFGALTSELANVFIENAIGTFSLPLGIATNFRVNGRDVLIPMAVEETSVLAAASHGAKLVRAGGGFKAQSSAAIMTGQVQLYMREAVDFDAILKERKMALIAQANKGQERLVERGGGVKDLTWRFMSEIESLVIHLHVDTCDAMGANIVNSMCEKLSVMMPELFSCDVGLCILTNLTDRRLTKVSCRVPASALDSQDYKGEDVVDRIVRAYEFGYYDVYRATTNNKGIMNGIDPVLIATGNDWRAVEAGAHAYTCRTGTYRPMAVWEKDEAGDLRGTLELPMAVGTVGGVTTLHPTAKAALKVLGSPNARELAEIVTAVGLAQNLSALRALASEGIQRGHMNLHRRNIDLLSRQGARKP